MSVGGDRITSYPDTNISYSMHVSKYCSILRNIGTIIMNKLKYKSNVEKIMKKFLTRICKKLSHKRLIFKRTNDVSHNKQEGKP